VVRTLFVSCLERIYLPTSILSLLTQPTYFSVFSVLVSKFVVQSLELKHYFFLTCSSAFTVRLALDPLLTLRRLMSYIYGAPILDVSRSHTTTQHSR